MGDLSPGIPDHWICLANPNVQMNSNMSLLRFKDSLGAWSTVCLFDYFTLAEGNPVSIFDQDGLETKYNFFYSVQTDRPDHTECLGYRSLDKKILVFDWIQYNTNIVRFGKLHELPSGLLYLFPEFSLENYGNLVQLGPDVIIAGKKIIPAMRKLKPHLRNVHNSDIYIDDGLGFLVYKGVVKEMGTAALYGFGRHSDNQLTYNLEKHKDTPVNNTRGTRTYVLKTDDPLDQLHGSIMQLPSNTLFENNIRYNWYPSNVFLTSNSLAGSSYISATRHDNTSANYFGSSGIFAFHDPIGLTQRGKIYVQAEFDSFEINQMIAVNIHISGFYKKTGDTGNVKIHYKKDIATDFRDDIWYDAPSLDYECPNTYHFQDTINIDMKVLENEGIHILLLLDCFLDNAQVDISSWQLTVIVNNKVGNVRAIDGPSVEQRYKDFLPKSIMPGEPINFGPTIAEMANANITRDYGFGDNPQEAETEEKPVFDFSKYLY
jgi:hypothetical protein